MMELRICICVVLSHGLSLINGRVGSTVSSNLKAKFISLVHFNVKLQPNPVTVRYLTLEKNSSESSTDLIASIQNTALSGIESQDEQKYYALLIGNNKPFIESPDENSLTTGKIRGKIERFRYIVIAHILDLTLQLNSLNGLIEKTINQRLDRTIFVVKSKHEMETLLNLATVKGLRDKYFLCETNPSDIFTDPLIFDKTNPSAYISVSAVDTLPIRKSMGGLLRGRHLKTGQSEIFHWAYIESRGSNDQVNFTGSFVQIQKEAMKRFNYTLDIEQLDTYASFENGSWKGTTGCVLNGECDLSICLSPEYLWGSQMEFSPWIDTAILVFWTNYPRKDPKWYGFLLPLTPLVWACVFFSFLAFCGLFFIIKFKMEGCKWTPSVFETGIQLPFAVLLEQDIPNVPSGIMRYVTGMWFLAALVIGTGYRSTLRKNLLFPPEDAIPLTHPELSERTDFKSTLYSFGELELEHFLKSTDPKILRISKRLKMTEDRVGCLEEVVLNYKQTCSSWYPPSAMLVAKFLTISTLFDPLVHSKDHIALSYMTLAFPKDSIYVDTFSPIISAICESGIYSRFAEEETIKLKKSGVEYWEKEVSQETKEKSKIYQRLKTQLETKDDSDTKPLTLRSVCVVLLFVPAGGILAFVVYILEKIRFSNKPEEKCFSTPVVTFLWDDQK